MRLTVLCVCGTLVAFLSLSRTRAEEGIPLEDRGFGPCLATFRPVGACKPGEHDSTCPYHISLPPLDVHLPLHFLGLENIMQDLQNLKDSVDELREMCADCTGGRAGRNCGKQSERELKGGKNMHEDKTLEENDGDFKHECGKDSVNVEMMEADNNMGTNLKDRNKWEIGESAKENERQKPVAEGARGEDTLEGLKTPTSGGNLQTVNVTEEKVVETNPEESVMKYQDIFEKKREKTTEESDPLMWEDKMKKLDENTKAEAFDKVKMSKNHTVNTNKKLQREMEKDIKVNSNKKKPKQMERSGLTEKGTENKRESVQRDGIRDTPSIKTTEKTDLFSISPTPLTTGLTSVPDPSDTKSFTSFVPSPSLISPTLSSITDVMTDVIRNPKDGYGLRGSKEPQAAGVSEVSRQVKVRLPTTTATISTVGGQRQQITNDVAGLTMKTPHSYQILFITTSPKVTDRFDGEPKRNVSSKTKTGLKVSPVRATNPSEMHKSGIKPEAGNRLKNAKNDSKQNQGPSTRGKTKLNPKQKPHKPKDTKSKPGKDSKQTQSKKPGQRNTPQISKAEENQKQHMMYEQEYEVTEVKSKQNFSTSVKTTAAQRPQTVNSTHSGKYTLINSNFHKTSKTDQNLKAEKKSIQIFINKTSDQESVKKLDSDEKLNNSFESIQNHNYVPNPTTTTNHLMNKSITKIPTIDPRPEGITEFETTPNPNQKTLNNSIGKNEEHIAQELKKSPDSTPGQNTTTHQSHTALGNMNDFSQEKLEPSQNFKIDTATQLIESVDKSEESSSQKNKSNPELKPGKTSEPDHASVTRLKTKPESTTETSPVSNKRQTSKEKPKLAILIEPVITSGGNHSHSPKSELDITPRRLVATDEAAETHHLKNNSSQPITKTKHKPKPFSPKSSKSKLTDLPKQNRKHSVHLENKPEVNPRRNSKNHPNLKQKIISDRANATLDYMNKTSQEDHRPKLKPEANNFNPEIADTSDKNSLQKVKSNPHLTPGQTSGLDQATKNPDQKRKSNEDNLKDKHRPKNIQEFKPNKTETATLKSTQKPLPESAKQSEDLQETTLYADLKPGSTLALNQTTTTLDQMNTHHKQTSRDSNLNKSQTETQKPSNESWGRFEERVLQEPTSNQHLLPGRTTATTYQLNKSDQDHLNTKHISENKLNFMSNKSRTATLEPKQKHLPESADKSEDNSLKETELYLVSSHEKTSTSDQATTNSDQIQKNKSEYIKTPTSREFKVTQIEKTPYKTSTESLDKPEETSLQGPTLNPGLTSGHTFTSDFATAATNQMKKSINSQIETVVSHESKFNKSKTGTLKLLAEQRENSEEASIQEQMPKPGLTPGETSLPSLDIVTTNQKNESTHYHHKANRNNSKSNEIETAMPETNQNPLSESKEKEQEGKSNTDTTSAPIQDKKQLDHRLEPSHNAPNFSNTPQPGQEPNLNQKNNKVQQTDQRLQTSRPYLKQISAGERVLKTEYNKTSKLQPPFRHMPSMRTSVRPGVKPIQRSKQAGRLQPSPQTKTDPPRISWAPSDNTLRSRTDMPPTSNLVKQIPEMSHTPGETEFSTSVKSTITLSPKPSNSLETGYSPAPRTHPKDVILSQNTRITSDLRPQTAGAQSSVPMTTIPNKINHGILPNVITSPGPEAIQPSIAPKSKPKTLHEEESPPANPVPSPILETTPTNSPDYSATTSTSDPQLPPAEPSSPSPRELRVKINQVAAFVNNSLIPKVGQEGLPKERPEGSDGDRGTKRTDGKLSTSTAFKAIRDCSDHMLRGRTRSGVYMVTPDLRSSSFQVYCDMELDGGGWTLLQRRQDGRVSFNRTWVEYRAGFGVLDGGDFWLGNNKIHPLTRDRDMELRVELEDFQGVTGHAQYEYFRVASERLRYRLTVGGYSGTAGDALRFSKTYDHNNRAFTTPDRDNDRYPSGNCGAYYSSGWWFDACMAANLNGRYYTAGRYKGVRDGIFWGTWHNISSEYYPTNERQSFKSVRMMIRPKSFGSH
ncbi:uncharacterized protein LOC119793002 isoform X1 [Cyprinodon tularosa]|uniref:uncharacterized protein LOC119793002 isoform X1 n=2 Tax=Cyprinodon tularosa TaxID=77115 RepID=UPI0018E23AFC|nr:uncharacterized protein LOC119793002 isoform X1 [Cyprinodon tularosa]